MISKKLGVPFFEATANPQKREGFLEYVINMGAGASELNGYKGAAKALMAETVGNPYTKWTYFNDGKNELEKAIALNLSNAELRYLRFLIQSECPSFLGYHSQLKSDYSFIINHIEKSEEPQSWVKHFQLFVQAKNAEIEQ